jgi:hypothetical protein
MVKIAPLPTLKDCEIQNEIIEEKAFSNGPVLSCRRD